MTGVCLVWCLVFFVFNVGFRVFKEDREIHEKIKKQQEEMVMTKEDYEAIVTEEEE